MDPRSARTTVGCSPDRVAVGRPTTCTATVTDTSAGTVSAPTGTAQWSQSNSPGSFSDSACTLSQTGPGVAGCSVTYTPSAIETVAPTIFALYPGDSKHAGNNFSTLGFTGLTVIADVAPAAPTITGLANGDGQVGVSFVDANPGTSPITSHEVTATDVDDPTAPR